MNSSRNPGRNLTLSLGETLDELHEKSREGLREQYWENIRKDFWKKNAGRESGTTSGMNSRILKKRNKKK